MIASTPDLLAAIVAATRRTVALRERECPLDAIERRQSRQPRGPAFAAALKQGAAPRVIAECKRRSPSRGMLRAVYDPATHAASYEAAGAAAISVLTEPAFFDGSLDHLSSVRAAVAVPVLRKDFIVSEYQLAEAAAAGADAVLLIVAALDRPAIVRLLGAAAARNLAVLVEVHDLDELRVAVDAGAAIVGVNSRNLRTLEVDLSVLDRVADALPRGVTAVAESGLRTGSDVRRLSNAGYDAFLVGERLMAAPDPGAALRELRHS